MDWTQIKEESWELRLEPELKGTSLSHPSLALRPLVPLPRGPGAAR